MHIFIRGCGVMVCVLAFAGPGWADVISVNFIHANDNHPLAQGELAGLVKAGFWNNVTIVPAADGEATTPDNVDTLPLMFDSDGDALVGVDLTYKAGDDAAKATSDVDPSLGPDYRMMGSTLFGNKTGNTDGGKNEYFEISGLGSTYTGPGYDLLLYYSNTSAGGSGEYRIDENADGSIDITPPSINRSGPTFSGSYVEVTDLDGQGNYIRVEGLTASSVRVTIYQTSGAEFGVSGLQIVPVPEPASAMLLAMGVLGLTVRRGRRARPARDQSSAQPQPQSRAARTSSLGRVTALIAAASFVVFAADHASAVLITDVQVTGTGLASEGFELMPSGFGEDALAFTDRPHLWNDLPAGLPQLVDAAYIKLANDDRAVSDFVLTMTISQPATIYLLWDDRVPVRPWMTSLGLADTGLDVGVDEGGNDSVDRFSSIFSGSFAAGDVVFEQQNQSSTNMYGVVIVPEPASLAMLTIGGLITMRRRR